MTKVAILDDYNGAAEKVTDWGPVRERAEVTVFDHHLGDTDAVAEALKDFDIISAFRERTAFPRELFEKLPNLKYLVFTGPYSDFVDLDAATDHNVLVSATEAVLLDSPDESLANAGYATPELTWALVMAVSRNIGREDRAIRAGGWLTTLGWMLWGKTIGIVGVGRMGSRVVHYAKAFGMKVIAWSPNFTPERAAAAGVEYVDKETLFRESDVVSIHMRPAPSTMGLVSAREFEQMKPRAVLINTSRGPIVDEAALIEALQTEQIAGAGLDVFNQEPLPVDHPLRSIENVILTPHLGCVTEEHYRVFYDNTVENILAFMDGNPIRVVNETGGLHGY